MVSKSSVLAALYLCNCAVITKSPYEYIVTKTYGERVELELEERQTLDSNYRKAQWMIDYDALGWVSTDTLMARLGHQIDTGKLGGWVIFDSTAYYGKLEAGLFKIYYEFDFRNKEHFFKENRVPTEKPKVTKLALAQEKAMDLFKEDRGNNYEKINPCARIEGMYVDVYLIPAHTNKYYVLGGGWFSRWDSETLQLVKKRKLHEAAYPVERSNDDLGLHWSSKSNAVLNEVDLFQAFRLKKRFNLQAITTNKYIFTHEGLSRGFQFDVFGTRFLEDQIKKRKK